MPNQVTGKIERIAPTVQIQSKDGTKTYQKRELTLNLIRFDPYTGEPCSFDNYPTFEFSGDKCAELDRYKTGQVVTVSFDLQGTKYTDKDGGTKYFTRIRGYKIEPRQTSRPQGAQQATPQPQSAPQYQASPTPPFPPSVDAYGNPQMKDDLPF